MIFELISILDIYFYFLFFNKFRLLNEDKNISAHKKFLENDKTPILIGGCFLITVLFFFQILIFFQ